MTLTPVAKHLAVELSLPVLTHKGCHGRDLNTNPLYARQMLYLMCHHSDSRDRMGASEGWWQLSGPADEESDRLAAVLDDVDGI